MTQYSALTQELLERIQSDMELDFAPHSFLHFKDDYHELSALWEDFRRHLLTGPLDRLTKEMIFIVVSVSKQCEYCRVVHSAFARRLGLPEGVFVHLQGNLRSIAPAELSLLLQYCQAIVQQSEHRESLRDRLDSLQHYNDEQLKDAIAMTGFAAMITTLANGLMLDGVIEREFYQMLAD